jgi:hypothetical protein
VRLKQSSYLITPQIQHSHRKRGAIQSYNNHPFSFCESTCLI